MTVWIITDSTMPDTSVGFTAAINVLCPVGSYMEAGSLGITGQGVCQPCPRGRYGSQPGLASPACSGACVANVASGCGSGQHVCSEGATSPLGTKVQAYVPAGFQPNVVTSAAAAISSSVVCDVNNDGVPEIVGVSTSSESVVVFQVATSAPLTFSQRVIASAIAQFMTVACAE
jgi:hypothetical protein